MAMLHHQQVWCLLLVVLLLLLCCSSAFSIVPPSPSSIKKSTAARTTMSPSQDQEDEQQQAAAAASGTTVDDDARAYNQYASAAVDLSHAQHFPAFDEDDDSAASRNNNSNSSNYYHFSVVRSVRDIDGNRRRLFLYSRTIAATNNGADAAASSSSSLPPLSPPVQLDDDVQWRLVSPSGRKVAVLVNSGSSSNNNNGNGKSAKPQQFLQIWTRGGQQLERIVPLVVSGDNNGNSSQNLHGKVVFDAAGGGFGRPAWNGDETCLVYSAERNPPKTSSFFAASADEEDGGGNNKKKAMRGGQYTLGQGKSENWGERYSKQSALLDLFVVNVETGRIGRIENVPGNDEDEDEPSSPSLLGGYALGQAAWSPDGEAIVYVGWDAGGPRRLGMVYCQQRPSKLYASSVSRLLRELEKEEATADNVNDDDDDGKNQEEREGKRGTSAADQRCTVLTKNLRVARSPKFSPAGNQLVFLAAERAFDTHSGCFGLHSIDWKAGFVANADGVDAHHRILVPQVWNPLQDKASKEAAGEVAGLPFPGLFVFELPPDPFCSPTDLITTTQWGSCHKVVRISLLTGKVQLVRIDTGGGDSSHEIICMGKDGSAFVVVRSLNQPGIIWHILNSELLREEEGCGVSPYIFMKFRPLTTTTFSPVPGLPRLDFDVSIQQLLPDDVAKFDGADTDLVVQSILLIPKKHPKPPLIVCLHGGPHSAYTTTFFHSMAFLCEYGNYAILIPNYRGSTGFGQASIEALPTNIGDMDVKDVIAATNQAIKSGLVDPVRIAICGGSHGGFLTAHCTSQFPDLFKAAATRNPVVNLASMITATDIPDWCMVEAIGSHNWNEYRPATKDEVDIMFDCSPVKRVSSVKCPTLVAIGCVDLRVPPSQGLEWYHTLRSMNVPTKLLVYPDDCHAIDGVAAEADQWVNTKRWFDKYLRGCG